MSVKEIENFLTKNTSWFIAGDRLKREIVTKNWSHSISIANMVSFLAEKFNHHPDLTIKYSKVEITLYTYDSGNITGKDLNLAKKIEELLEN